MIKYGNNAVVGQSGGPTSAINASLAGVINAALKSSEIGKLYVSLYKEAPASEFAALVEGIKASEETIAKYKDQIKDIKGILTCTSCGAEIPTGSAFCSSCGTAAPVVEAPVGPVCSNCGAALTEGSAFCTSCGASVSAPATDPNKCAKCGAVLAEDSAFCTSCGAKR